MRLQGMVTWDGKFTIGSIVEIELPPVKTKDLREGDTILTSMKVDKNTLKWIQDGRFESNIVAIVQKLFREIAR